MPLRHQNCIRSIIVTRPTDLPFLPPDKVHRSLIFMLLHVCRFFLFMSTTSRTLLESTTHPLPSPSPLLCIIHRSSNFPGWLPLDWRVFIADSLRLLRQQERRSRACSQGSLAGVPSRSGGPKGIGGLHYGRLGRWPG